MRATFVIQDRNTNAPCKMCATPKTTAKQMQEMRSKEMRGKKLSHHFPTIAFDQIPTVAFDFSAPISSRFPNPFLVYYALHQSTELLKFDYIECIFSCSGIFSHICMY